MWVNVIDDGIQELQEPGDLLKRSKKNRQPLAV